MAGKKRKKIHSAHRLPNKESSAQVFYTPFEGLDQHLTRTPRRVALPPRLPPRSVVVEWAEEEEVLFRKAMADVVPLDRGIGGRVPPPPPTRVLPRFLRDEEVEVRECLMNLVSGETPFELTHSDEYVEGAVVGLSPGTLKKLRRGDFSYREHLDLHGLYPREAYQAVIRFVERSHALGYRCILIVPGRGLNSEGKEPVLKFFVVKWLTQAPIRRLVLAFASARSHDGGAGAFYVLLRRNERKAPFEAPLGR